MSKMSRRNSASSSHMSARRRSVSRSRSVERGVADEQKDDGAPSASEVNPFLQLMTDSGVSQIDQLAYVLRPKQITSLLQKYAQQNLGHPQLRMTQEMVRKTLGLARELTLVYVLWSPNDLAVFRKPEEDELEGKKPNSKKVSQIQLTKKMRKGGHKLRRGYIRATLNPASADEPLMLAKVGLTTLDLRAPTWCQTEKGKDQLRVHASYSTSRAAHTVELVKDKMVLPDSKWVYEQVRDKFENKRIRPDIICRYLSNHCKTRDAEFLLFFIDPAELEDGINPARALALGLERRLRKQLSVTSRGIARATIRSLRPKKLKPSEGPTEWIISDRVFLRELKNKHSALVKKCIDSEFIKKLGDEIDRKKLRKPLSKPSTKLWLKHNGIDPVEVEWAAKSFVQLEKDNPLQKT